MTSKEMQMTPQQIEEMNDLAYSYEYKEHRNCYGCCQTASDYEDAFKAGYKAAMEKAKVLEDALDWYAQIGDGAYSQAHLYLRAKAALKEYRGEV